MFLISETLSDVSLTIDESQGKKELYIEGVFLESERKNRNGRIYPKKILEREVNTYVEQYVSTNRAFGELSHPQATEINPDRISHLITSINEDGTNYFGKAKILDTPTGNIVKGLLEGGGQIGISSRGLGTVKMKNGINEVQSDYSLRCLDLVTSPSGIDCFVEMVMEGELWVPKSDIVEEIRDDIHNTKNLQDEKIKAFETFLRNI